jgi:spoIIIJ-associated protein
VQWVVTTGRSVEEARRRALDALGIDEVDLDFEVLAEPQSRLFGLRRTEARIRARVRPTRPRPKVERRSRRKPSGGGGQRRRDERRPRGDQGRSDDATTDDAVDAVAPRAGAASGGTRAGQPDAGGPEDGPTEPARPRPRRPRGARRPADGQAAPADRAATPSGEAPTAPADPDPDRGALDLDAPDPADPGPTGDTMSDISLDEQQPSAVDFVEGLVQAFGVDAEVSATMVDDEHLEIAVTGADLGLLVGSRGRTLEAIQELTRTAVAQQQSGRLQGRLRVDVAGYRARRKEALERFARQQAERVRETGIRVALEPMSPPDRKIVHDAINDIDGVHTTSEGEDRRRHVVILPD